tara:strand:- start:2113 stop:2418 length:306 start_codon:yes stop_codon:yes gene_type:complete
MVEYIDISGKKYPVRFGFNALREFSRKTGTTLADLGSMEKNITLDQAITLAWCGFKDGARKDKITFKLDVSDIADLLDEDPNVLERVFNVFNEQFSDGKKK